MSDIERVTGPGYELWRGDCLEVLPLLDLGRNVAIVTDPPYGDSHDTDYTRFTGGVAANRNWYQPIANDEKPFDPSPWLTFGDVVLCGSNRFSDKLQIGTLFVWDKRTPGGNKNVMSDAEVIWWNHGRGVYIFEHTWDGFNRTSERGTAYHPAQKPVALFDWILNRINLLPFTTIVDPYMGSGAVGIAAVKAGHRYIGIELKENYFAIAARRIADAARAAAGQPKQLSGHADDYDALPMFAGLEK